ncbi:hypothetical protein EDC01DRAFT_195301 [Geopyxis carbonaria]|nr:hypothetical protein EDC01DRAFT_195301 [Geopyxis carbonaria]
MKKPRESSKKAKKRSFGSSDEECWNRVMLLFTMLCRRGSGSGGDSISKKPKQRRSRNRKGRPQMISPTFSNGMSSSPFFNFANGTVTSPMEIPEIDTTGPIMELSGGAPMSPTANALLPSNLFSLEDNSPSPPAASPISEEILSRNSAFDAASFNAPQSPLSSGSVSTSPRSSFNHIPLFSNLSGPREVDGENLEPITGMSPIGSNRPLGASAASESENADSSANGGRRFVRLLSSSFNRQRGKTMPFDGPPVGSLRSSESHSFPKKDSVGLDPIGTRRRSGSYGSWTNGFDFLHGTSKGKIPLQRTNSQASRHSAGFNQFNPSLDLADQNKLFDVPVSPRPSSISSFDNPLPAPSSDASAAFGWPTHDTMDASRNNRIGILGNNQWADFRTGRISRSRPVSRPISPINNNSTTSLSLLPSQQMGGPSVGYFASSILGPNMSGRPVTPRLNPTAPTFQSKHSASKSEDVEELSRDSMSIRTNISVPSTVGTTASGTSLETVPTKESILARFSKNRKGSTSKFNIGWKKTKRDESEDEAAENSANTSSTRHLWSSWKKDKDREEGDESESEKPEKVTPATTPLAKESSPWMKSSQSGFFGTIGRKKGEKPGEKDEELEEKTKDHREKDKDNLEKESDGEKKARGIFKRKPTAEKERGDSSLVLIEES